MNERLIKILLKHGESRTLEFKSGQVSNSVAAQVVCAFANTGGGRLIIGVDDHGAVHGVKDAEERNMELRRFVRTTISPQPYFASDVADVSGGSQVIVVDVPSSDEKPYTFEDSIHVRHNAETVTASGEEIRKLISSRHPRYLKWERQLALGVSMDELDGSVLRETADQGNASNLEDFGPDRSPQSILDTLGLIEGESICNGAIVLFGRNPARRFPQVRVRAVRYAGTDREHLTDNRVFDGNVFKILKQAKVFVDSHVPIESSIPTAGLRRREGPAVPSKAVREALLNAVAHRDYAASDGGITVSIYSDRIEVWNSAVLPEGMSATDLPSIRVSRPHNPAIAHVLLICGYMERVGSGIQRILSAFRDAKLPRPEWHELGGGLNLSMRWKSRTDELNERQRRMAEKLAVGDTITLSEYRERYAKEIGERQARTDLRGLVDLGYLRIAGRGRATRYLCLGK
jgi:ATP-dependent DNA helicase RecG